MTTFVTLTGML